MRKHKNKIIAGVAATLALAFAFWWGGDAPEIREWNHQTEETNISERQPSANNPFAVPESAEETQQKGSDIPIKEDGEPAAEANEPQKTGDTPMTAEEKAVFAEQNAESNPVHVESSVENDSEASKMEIDESTGKDPYQTEPVPEGMPVPIEPENAVISDKQLTCTLSVRCDSILENIARLDEEKVQLVPKDGVIYAEKTVTFYEGESVFNLLVREMKQNKIHMEFENTPVYNSAYIEGIGNLYEFDCGELSGWTYQVNDWFPNYGCSRYLLKEGDRVAWVYTCDLGADVGGSDSARNGK